MLRHSRGDRHQELVEASEKDIGSVADPNVVCGAHDKQETRLQRCYNTDYQFGP